MLLHFCLYLMVFLVVLTPLLAVVDHRPRVLSVYAFVGQADAEQIDDGLSSFACFVGSAMRHAPVLGNDEVVGSRAKGGLGLADDAVFHNDLIWDDGIGKTIRSLAVGIEVGAGVEPAVTCM